MAHRDSIAEQGLLCPAADESGDENRPSRRRRTDSARVKDECFVEDEVSTGRNTSPGFYVMFPPVADETYADSVAVKTEPKEGNSPTACSRASPVLAGNDSGCCSSADSSSTFSKDSDIVSKLDNIQATLKLVLQNQEQLACEVRILRLRRENAAARPHGRVPDPLEGLQRLPCRSVEEIEELEVCLKNDGTKAAQLVNYLKRCRGISVGATVRQMLPLLFTDALSDRYTWKGTTSKRQLRGLHTLQAIYDSVRGMFHADLCADKVIQKEAREWFRHSGQRLAKVRKSK